MEAKVFCLIFLQLFFSFTSAWFETCSNSLNVPIASSVYVTSPGYPSSYTSGSSCKWYLQAPTGYTIQLQCTYNLQTPLSDCQSQRFYVSRDGDKDLNYAEYFCGYSTLTKVSVGNEITLGYTSNTGGNGWLYCEAKAILTTQSNCQCGWSKTVRTRMLF